MEYKVFVFTCDKLHNVNFDIKALQRVFASCNASIEELSFLKLSQDSISAILSQNQNLILFMANQNIDKVIADNISKLSNEQSVVDEELVIFKKDGKNIIFLPYDVEWQKLLEKVKLSQTGNKSCEFKLFAVTKEKAIEGLENIKQEVQDFDYSVLNDGLLTQVYISYNGSSNLIDDVQVRVANLFRDNLYSENSVDLGQCIGQLVSLQGIKLCICEGISGGLLLENICLNSSNADGLIEQAKIEYLHKTLSPDNVYEQTTKMISPQSKDVLLVNVQGQYENGKLEIIYTLGYPKAIDVYKSTFIAPKQEAIKMAVDAIMFNIIKKLRQNNLVI